MTVVAPPLPTNLTPCQRTAWDVLQREGNVLLTGAAGTGKSWLLQQYLADKATEDFPVVASTGAAAVLVGGRTFHSFFGLGILEGGVDAAVARAVANKKVGKRLQRACCVVIDEVSMLPGSLLAAADAVARRTRGNDEPWGGLRIIAVGDFAQLPPVTRDVHTKDWAFLHSIWETSSFQPALLSTVVRTREPEFLRILNFIRDGEVNHEVVHFLQERLTSEPPEDCTRLYAHRHRAHSYNLQRLQQIDAPLHAFPTTYEGDNRYEATIKRSMPIPETLQLKTGALVMLRKNDPSPEPRWVNGSLGYIESIADDSLRIQLLNGNRVTVEPEKFSYLGGDGKEVAAAWNFPVSLSWATTIHKAQGASVDRIHVDIANLWEPGQAYVALSRARSASGITIDQWQSSAITVDPAVTQFYNDLAEAMGKYVPRPLFQAPTVHPEDKVVQKKRTSHKDRYSETKRLLQEKTPLSEIAHYHHIKEDSVVKHIDKLVSTQASSVDLSYLRDGLAEYYELEDAFRQHGTEYLKPIYEALDETVPYEIIRLARSIYQWEMVRE